MRKVWRSWESKLLLVDLALTSILDSSVTGFLSDYALPRDIRSRAEHRSTFFEAV